ncbi:hypothetical protein HOI26_05030, partial [Candidatus Woesearchaeota archaeon]|nr:hypothetical protein [Candidatus Woesearchaeota archaeon]
MIILGVEFTAHTFGVGIVTDKGKVLANIYDSYTTDAGGMLPDDVVEHHKEVSEKILGRALQEAEVTWDDISIISYSAGPGLDPALWTGYEIVKKWSAEYAKKLVGINHPAAHLSIGKMWNKLQDPCY